MIVSNSTPIINFGRQGKLDILRRCFDKIFIPKSVYDEIMQKKESPEAIILDKSINEKWTIVEDIAINPLLNTMSLGKGEKEAISLALQKKCELLIDDDYAKAYAKILNVESHGSFYVLYLACLKKIIDKEEAKNIFGGMIREGFYVSIELYSRFLELLGK
ncbi:DUF3368 domain-containing protein [Candidatus Pacearchaeota archaeon]|nr:DUF3368 domain-containing protein [Candidatus Pacearchaeota archaeon]